MGMLESTQATWMVGVMLVYTCIKLIPVGGL